mgnify:CR=1 FL=1
MTWQVSLEYKLPQTRYALHIMHANPDGSYDYVTDLTFTKVQLGQMPESPGVLAGYLAYDTRQLMQALVDEAWAHGIYPQAVKENSGELKATRGHLQDMRRLAFSVLEVPEVE